MPDLPTLTLSQQDFDRVVAAFPGADLGQKAEAYNAWLASCLIGYVENVEMDKIERDIETYRATKMAEIAASLPPRPQFPPEWADEY